MHEFSLAQEIVRTTLQELTKRPGARLLTVRVVVGRMRQVVPDTMHFAFRSLVQDSPAAGAALVLRWVPIVLACPKCGQETEIAGPPFWCPACGSTRVDLRSGNELYLEELEIEEDHVGNDQDLS
jgi:hydrogenase nickel incorporation protein HypA/HybF